MNKKDMYKARNAVLKLYNESLNRDFSVANDCPGEDVFWEANKSGYVVRYNGYTLAFAKCTKNEKDCIRIMCAIRTKMKVQDGDKEAIKTEKKVKVIEHIIDFIRVLEDSLSFIDECNVYEVRNFMYVDSVKILN